MPEAPGDEAYAATGGFHINGPFTIDVALSHHDMQLPISLVNDAQVSLRNNTLLYPTKFKITRLF